MGKQAGVMGIIWRGDIVSPRRWVTCQSDFDILVLVDFPGGDGERKAQMYRWLKETPATVYVDYTHFDFETGQVAAETETGEIIYDSELIISRGEEAVDYSVISLSDWHKFLQMGFRIESPWMAECLKYCRILSDVGQSCVSFLDIITQNRWVAV